MNTTALQIAPTLPQHLNTLVHISRLTFTQAFASQNTPQNMQHYLQTALSPQQLETELCNPNSAFYFAIYENNTIGYLKLNFNAAQTEFQQPDGVEIERIYILTDYYGTGAGLTLLNYAVAVTRQRGAAYIWLGVWEKNSRAIRFYQKNGFVAFGNHSFMLGQDVQNDVLMKLDL